MELYKKVQNYILRKATEKGRFVLPNHEELENLKIRFIDIGAADGLNHRILFLAPILDVTAFEPDYRSLDKLSEILKSQGVRKQEVLPIVLNSEKQKVNIFLTNKRTCSSIYKPNLVIADSYQVISKYLPMETVTTESKILDDEVDYADWIKLDTQGSEKNILSGAERILKNCAVVETEVEYLPLYENQPVYDEVAHFLRYRGFQLFDLTVSGHREPYLTNSIHTLGSGKTAMFGNAVFIKNEYLPWNLSVVESGQILKVVLILLSYKKIGLAVSIIVKAKSIGVLEQVHEDLIVKIFNTRFNGYLFNCFQRLPKFMTTRDFGAVSAKNFKLDRIDGSI